MENTAQRAVEITCKRVDDGAQRRRVSGGKSARGGDGQAALIASDSAMLRWLDMAVRYHSARYLDEIVAFKTVAGPGVVDGLPALYVWEVARTQEADGMRWAFIVWDVSGLGVRFLECAGEADAMRLYDLPLTDGLAAVAHAPGVRMRPGLRAA